MRYLAIPPRRHLNTAKYADGLFIIPPHIDSEETKEQIRKLDCYKMLDNGSYELGKPLNDDDLIDLAEGLNVNAIVAPDQLHSQMFTVQRTLFFLDIVPDKFEVVVVPQGMTPEDYIDVCLRFAEIDRVDIIALPIWLEKKFSCRPEVYRYVRRRIQDKKFHLLGLDNPYEVLLYEDDVVSVDTSLPFTLAKHNIRWIKPKRYELERVSFDETLENPSLARYHIERLMELCHTSG